MMKEFLHHFFLPRHTNNYRAGVLHHKILLSFIIFFFSAGFLMSYLRTNFPSVLGTFADISNQQLLLLTNQKREENGLPDLTMNDNLSVAASNKASDMFGKDYWAHNAPDGTTPWFFIKGAGYNYIYAGENLARGFNTAPDVINAWMESPGHRKNMLSSNYQNVGFAVSTGKLSGEDTVLVVEMFGSISYAPPAIAKEPEKPATVVVASGSSATIAKVDTETLGAEKMDNYKSKIVVANSLAQIKPLINSETFSLVSIRLIMFMFMSIFILDMIVVERKKVLRFVGHNLDHLFLFSLVLLVIIVLAKGVVV